MERMRLRINFSGWFAVMLLLAGFVGGSCSNARAQASSAVPGAKQSKSSATSAKVQELLNQGNDQLQGGNFVAAAASFRAAIQSDPAVAEAHRGLGVALWREGHAARAWSELRTATRLAPGSANAHYELSNLAWYLYQHPESRSGKGLALGASDFQMVALEEAQKAVGLKPRDFNMRLTLAQFFLSAGQNKQAHIVAQKAVDLAGSRLERSTAQVTLARALLETGDQERADAELQKALQENPNNGAAYLCLGDLRQVQQRPAEAVASYRQAIQASPDLEPAYAALAELLAKSHQPLEAAPLFEKAVSLDPEDWQARYHFAVLLMGGGQSGRARQMLVAVIAQQPGFLPAREHLAMLYLRQGNQAGALAEAQAMIARDPQAGGGHRVLALVMWRQRKIELSLSECALALGADPHSASMLALQSIELWQQKQKRDARTSFVAAAHEDPGVASFVTFCRLIACEDQDIPVVNKFLRKIRWVLNPRANQ